MKNLLIAITLGLTLTACDGSDTTSEKQMTTKELVAEAAAGDKGAMRDLERQVAKKAKADKKKMEAAAGGGDPVAVFQKAMMSGQGSGERIAALAASGNPNAQLWLALDKRSDEDLTDADKQLYRDNLLTIARHGQNEKYIAFSSPTWSLSAEAAFQISEDKLSNKGLFEADTEGAIKYLKQAANEGQTKAMLKLSSRYEYALDMDKDLAAAKMWLEKAAVAGNYDAKRELKRLQK